MVGDSRSWRGDGLWLKDRFRLPTIIRHPTNKGGVFGRAGGRRLAIFKNRTHSMAAVTNLLLRRIASRLHWAVQALRACEIASICCW